jgi:excisionase family DNA binding protein
LSATNWLQLPGFREAVEQITEVPANDGWLDSKAAAEYLGISRATIHNLVNQGRLPRHGRKGHKLTFRKADLDGYAEGASR